MGSNKWERSITPGNPTLQAALPFTPVVLSIMNSSAYTLLVKRGSQQLPEDDSYDYKVPPGENRVIPVVGREFAFRLDVQVTVNPRYQSPCQIIFVGDNEAIPSFSSSGYRESTRLDHSIVTGDLSSDIFDARAARAMFLSIRNDNAYVYSTVHASVGYLEVFTANDVASFGTPAAKLTRTIPLPLSVQSVEAVVPLAASFVEIKIQNPYGVVNPLHVQIDVALMDEIPPFIPRRVTEYVYPVWNTAAPGTYTILQEKIQCQVPYLDVTITPFFAPSDPFNLWLSIYHVEGGGGPLTQVRFSSDNTIIDTFGHGRQGVFLMGYDPTNGKRVWRIPAVIAVDRFFALQLSVSAATPSLVEMVVPFEMEI